MVPLLKPVDKCWQPADLLPESSDPDFMDKVAGVGLWLSAVCFGADVECPQSRYPRSSTRQPAASHISHAIHLLAA